MLVKVWLEIVTMAVTIPIGVVRICQMYRLQKRTEARQAKG